MAGVTPNGIHYPDGASKAKNLGPELEQMALDIDTWIDENIDPDNPDFQAIVRDMAEQLLAALLEAQNITRAYPEEPLLHTSLSEVPFRWTYKTLDAPVPAAVTQTVEGTWTGSAQRWGNVPVLSQSGYLDPAQVPDSIARVADLPAPVEPVTPRRILSANVPVLAARVAVARTVDEPCAVVFVGSSTTAAMPGYVAPLGRLIQECYPVEQQTAPQRDGSANFTPYTTPGIHVYNAGEGGTTASDYLTDAECDRIAALDPALIHHMVGSNDFFMSVDPETYRANLLARLAYLDSVVVAPVQHVLVHQYERMDASGATYTWDEYRQVLADIAEARADTVLLDLSEPYAATGIPSSDPLDLISGDDIHQNPRGYAFMTDLDAAFYLTT